MAQFHTSKVLAGDDGRSVIVEGRLLSGQVRPGMELHIPMNGSFSMTVPVREVCADGSGLVLDCEGNPPIFEAVQKLRSSGQGQLLFRRDAAERHVRPLVIIGP